MFSPLGLFSLGLLILSVYIWGPLGIVFMFIILISIMIALKLWMAILRIAIWVGERVEQPVVTIVEEEGEEVRVMKEINPRRRVEGPGAGRRV